MLMAAAILTAAVNLRYQTKQSARFEWKLFFLIDNFRAGKNGRPVRLWVHAAEMEQIGS